MSDSPGFIKPSCRVKDGTVYFGTKYSPNPYYLPLEKSKKELKKDEQS